jgi:hypothetical protein
MISTLNKVSNPKFIICYETHTHIFLTIEGLQLSIWFPHESMWAF